jgi:hypothetical protein
MQTGKVRIRTAEVRFPFSSLPCAATMLNGVTSNHAVFPIVDLLKNV